MKLEWNQKKVADEIMQYRELLDEGIITEEEYSIKKEELLFSLKK